jgi:signal transduction histidine kinase
MPRRGRAGRPSRSSLAVGALLAGTVASSVLLALEAYRAVAYHRRTAVSVLRDYASLAAAEMVRRSSNEVGYYGYYPLATALANAAREAGRLPPDVMSRLARDTDPQRRPSRLVRTVFAWHPRSGLVWAGPAFPPMVADWLRARLPSTPAPQMGYEALHATIDGAPHTFVLAALQSEARLGFEVELPALSDDFARAFAREPLLPSSLGHGAVTNARVAVVVRDQGGVERFRSPAREFADLRVQAPFGDAYGGALGGSTVTVSLDPADAPRLVIGGLPRSRAPALMGLLAVNTALVAAAAVLLRRERQLQRLRADFVASVSHELRTPLTQIRMFAETLLLERVRSPAEGRRALEIIDKEARRLTNLVENLLMFSRAQRGAVPVAAEPRALAPLVGDTVEAFRPLLGESRLEVEADPDAQAAVDPDVLRQVLLNLLDNAVKYGPRGQTIRVRVERGEKAGARVVVEDEGPGIPPGERERVFERFHRLERESERAVAGTGIGLAVVRDLVTRLGGRVRAEAAAGGGARMVVELP